MDHSTKYALLLVFSMIAGATRAASNDKPLLAEPENLPDLELLEFLGKWETDAGDWIGPDVLIDEQFARIFDPVNAPEAINEATDQEIEKADQGSNGDSTND